MARTASRFVLAFLSAFIVLFWASGLHVAMGAEQTEIRVGMTNSFSGPLARSATPVWQGAMVWQDWVNSKGGVLIKDLGKRLPVRIVYYDDESKRDNVIRLYERLAVTDKVDFFLGPFASGLTYVAAAIADKHKKVMVSTTGSAPEIYSQGYKYIVQGIVGTLDFGRPYIDLIHAVEKERRTLAILYEDHLFPKSIATQLRPYAEKLGFKVVYFDKFAFGAPDISPALTAVKGVGADHIYIVANIEGTITAVRQMGELRVNARSIGILDNGMYYYLKALGPKALQGILGPAEWDISVAHNVNFGPSNREFMEFYKKRFGGAEPPDNHTPMGLNGGLILQAGIEKAGTLDSTKVRDTIGQIEITTLVGPFKIIQQTGVLFPPEKGGQIAIVTQWQKDGRTLTLWPPALGDLKKLTYPIPRWEDKL